MSIPDKAVEAAAVAQYNCDWGRGWEFADEVVKDRYREHSRVALEAAEPYLTGSSLRSELERLAREWANMDCRVDLPENASWGEGCAQGYSNAAAGLMRALAAHPEVKS